LAQPTTPIAFPSNFHRVAGTSVSRVDYAKLLGVTFDKHLNFDMHISNVCSSAHFHNPCSPPYSPFFDSETSKTNARNSCTNGLCQFHSYRHFFSQYPSSSARSKLLGSSRYSLNYQNYISSKFTSLTSNSATNQF